MGVFLLPFIPAIAAALGLTVGAAGLIVDRFRNDNPELNRQNLNMFQQRSIADSIIRQEQQQQQQNPNDQIIENRYDVSQIRQIDQSTNPNLYIDFIPSVQEQQIEENNLDNEQELQIQDQVQIDVVQYSQEEVGGLNQFIRQQLAGTTIESIYYQIMQDPKQLLLYLLSKIDIIITPAGYLQLDLFGRNPKKIPLVAGQTDQSKVYIGKRPLKKLGISIGNIQHWCVKVGNNIYSLDTDTGGIEGNIQISIVEDDKYDFYEYGTQQRSIDDVDQLVKVINRMRIKYTLLNDNCQKFSVIIAEYAIGNKSVQEIEQQIDQTNLQESKQIEEEDQERKVKMDEDTSISIEEQYKQFQEQNNKKQQQQKDFLEQVMRYRVINGVPVKTIGQTSSLVQTIGNQNNMGRRVLGQTNGTQIPLRMKYQNINYNNDFDYQQAYNDKNRILSYSSVIRAPNMQNQPTFNLYATQNQNAGSFQKRSLGNAVPTLREAFDVPLVKRVKQQTYQQPFDNIGKQFKEQQVLIPPQPHKYRDYDSVSYTNESVDEEY